MKNITRLIVQLRKQITPKGNLILDKLIGELLKELEELRLTLGKEEQ